MTGEEAPTLGIAFEAGVEAAPPTKPLFLRASYRLERFDVPDGAAGRLEHFEVLSVAAGLRLSSR